MSKLDKSCVADWACSLFLATELDSFFLILSVDRSNDVLTNLSHSRHHLWVTCYVLASHSSVVLNCIYNIDSHWECELVHHWKCKSNPLLCHSSTYRNKSCWTLLESSCIWKLLLWNTSCLSFIVASLSECDIVARSDSIANSFESTCNWCLICRTCKDYSICLHNCLIKNIEIIMLYTVTTSSSRHHSDYACDTSSTVFNI